MLYPRRDGTLQRFEQRVEIPGAVVAYPIDEERRSARHAVVPPLVEILLHALASLVAERVGLEALRVQGELAREVEEHAFGDGKLVRVDTVVHFPEAALFRGGLRGACHTLGAGMRALVWEMPKDIDQAIP